jgi:hypothetical protein
MCKPQVRLVNQGCSLQSVIRSLSPHVGTRQAVQFCVNEGQKIIRSALISMRHGPQKLRNLSLGIFHRPISGKRRAIINGHPH